MRTKSLVAVMVLTVSLQALAQRNSDLVRAQDLMGQREYAGALKALDAAGRRANVDRESLLTILELRGLAEASLGERAKAEQTFRVLVSLDPERELTGKYRGDIVKPIAAAQAWVAANGALVVVPREPTSDAGAIRQIGVVVKSDALKLARAVRFHLRQDGAPEWKVVDSSVTGGAASADCSARSVEWWAEVLGDRGAQLLLVGTAIRSIQQEAVEPTPPQVAAATDAPSVQPELVPSRAPAQEAPPAAVLVEPTREGSVLRPMGYAALGAGALAAGVGAGFGISSKNIRDGITRDLAAGRPQSELVEPDRTAIRQGQIANGLFIAGGALAATGIVLYFLGGDVEVTPGGAGGLSISGKLP